MAIEADPEFDELMEKFVEINLKRKENGEPPFILREGGIYVFQQGTYKRVKLVPKPNDPCSCGSKKKYKRCCG